MLYGPMGRFLDVVWYDLSITKNIRGATYLTFPKTFNEAPFEGARMTKGGVGLDPSNRRILERRPAERPPSKDGICGTLFKRG